MLKSSIFTHYNFSLKKQSFIGCSTYYVNNFNSLPIYPTKINKLGRVTKDFVVSISMEEIWGELRDQIRQI